MHIPDGFIDAPTSIGAAVLAAGGVAASLRGARRDIDDASSPESEAALTGLVAAFVFAAQMINFPVAAGTSGHLMGGVLAAILVGPRLGALAVTVVLIVQSLMFADGGISALGLNIINMAFIPAFVGYGIFWGVRRVLPRSRTGVLTASAVAAFLSVVLASLVFTIEYAIGGIAEVPVSTVAAAMVGVHGLIGVGEAVITTLTIGAVLATRPDLVFGARDLLPRRGSATVGVPA